MKAFLISLVVLVIVATGAALVLGAFQQNSDEVYATQNVRLN